MTTGCITSLGSGRYFFLLYRLTLCYGPLFLCFIQKNLNGFFKETAKDAKQIHRITTPGIKVLSRV